MNDVEGSCDGITESFCGTFNNRGLIEIVSAEYCNVCRVLVRIDCKTVRIFAYSSIREQSNKRFGTRLKTESETRLTSPTGM